MKICFIAPANNYHAKKFVNWFIGKGYEVHVVSFIQDVIPGATVHHIKTGVKAEDNDSKKLQYLFCAKKLKRVLDDIKPDIVNVHYATSYGTIVALSGIKPYTLSVWGSDIFEFPNKSLFHRLLLKYSLNSASHLFSTSQAMANEAAKYTKNHFDITPFGVDTELFSPKKRNRTNGDYVIGTIKGLSYKYGIDYLLKAVAIIHERKPDIPLKVRIAGEGSDEAVLKQLCDSLGISDVVSWLGFISQDQAANEWANMDVAVIPSLAESFGVSAVEAQSCGIPVIISDVPGLMEATNPGATSVVVPRRDERVLAEMILDLYYNVTMRNVMGMEGRRFVEEKYDYHTCFNKIEELLLSFLKCDT